MERFSTVEVMANSSVFDRLGPLCKHHEDASAHSQRKSPDKRQIKQALVLKFRFPDHNWVVKDFDSAMDLAILKDTMFELTSSVIPKKYNFSRYPIYDLATLSVFSRPVNATQLYVIPSPPQAGVCTYTTTNLDTDKAKFSEREKVSYMKVNTDDNIFEYCYEGKYLRAFRFHGQTRICTLNKLCIDNVMEDGVYYKNMIESTGVDVHSFFDNRYDYCDSVLHFLLCIPSSLVRTRRQVLAPYLVYLKTESIDHSLLKGRRYAPLKKHTLFSCLVKDDVSVPLSTPSGKMLTPARMTLGQVQSNLSRLIGEQVIVKDRHTGKVLGKLWNQEAFTLSLLKPVAIDGKGIAVECFRRSKYKDRSDLVTKNNLHMLLNIPVRTLQELDADPEQCLQLSDSVEGETVDDKPYNCNWALLTSVMYMYTAPMRRCIAKNAYELQKEVFKLRETFRHLIQDKYERLDGGDFDFEEVIDVVRMIYNLHPAEKEIMKEKTPMLFNLMRPGRMEKAAEVKIRY